MTELGELTTVAYVNMLSLGVIKAVPVYHQVYVKCLLFSAKQH